LFGDGDGDGSGLAVVGAFTMAEAVAGTPEDPVVAFRDYESHHRKAKLFIAIAR
jgi:hypothetical protein